MSVQLPKRAPRKASPSTRAAAFYDLDGTLTDLNLLHATVFFLANLAEWGGRISYLTALAVRLPRIYRAEQRDRRLLNVVLLESLKGVSRDRLEVLGDEYCERFLVGRLYPQAVALIERNREVGLEPVLVSGSPDFVVAPLARRLNIATFVANRLHYFRNLATGRLLEPVMAGEEKATWCENYAAEQGIDLDACWGYADSYYDLPFLTALGHPVAVNPDHRLDAAAHNRQWPIIRLTKTAPDRDRSREALA